MFCPAVPSILYGVKKTVVDGIDDAPALIAEVDDMNGMPSAKRINIAESIFPANDLVFN